MTVKVIQGFFIGGRPRLPSPVAQPTAMPRLPSPVAQPTAMPRLPGPPVPAFAGRPPVAQPRMPGPPVPAFAGRPPVAQRHGAGDVFSVDPGQLGLTSSGGRPLPEAVRGKMEAALGADFSNVRVHVGPQAERIGAIAFTLGTDIYFAPGRFQPDTAHGQQLLGHELAHVVQQRQGRVRNPIGSGVAVVQDRALEAEADRLGQRAVAHRVTVQAKQAPAGVQPSSPVRISAPINAGPGSYRLVAGSGGRQVGSVMVHARDKASVEVTDLGVDPAHREHGIGKMLLASAARTGLQSGRSKLTLAAQDRGSGHLSRWYKGMGFTQIGVKSRGYPQFEAPIGRVLAGSAQRRVAWRGPRTLQAMEASDQGLRDLARPKVLTLPQKQIKTQDELARKLNERIEQLFQNEIRQPDVIFGLGIIDITELDSKRGEFIKPNSLPIQWRSLGTQGYDKGEQLIKNDDTVKQAIIENVMDTLEQAGQIAYIKTLGLSREDWAILVDVHYYYDRPPQRLAFHKDTIGDTLFVNLNYLNDEEIAGPEYIISDPTKETTHLEYIKRHLPARFLEDLHKARPLLGPSTKIGATKIPRRGVISFVDELIYHATPLVGRRTVRSKELAEFIKTRTNLTKFIEESWYMWYSTASMIRLEMNGTEQNVEFNMTQVRQSGLGLTDAEIDELFAIYSAGGGRQNASIPGGMLKSGYKDPDFPKEEPLIAGSGAPLLTRRMSTWAVKGKLPTPPPLNARRQFFRTWVRAVKRTNINQ